MQSTHPNPPVMSQKEEQGKALSFRFAGLHAQTIIAYTAFLALLLSVFNFILNAKIEPIKRDIAKMEVRQVKMDNRLNKMEADINSLKAGQAELKTIILSIQEKLNK